MLRSRLVAARLYAETPDHGDGVLLNVGVDIGGGSPRSYKVDLGAVRSVTIPLTGEIAPAVVWVVTSWGYAGRIDDLEVDVERAVSKGLDQFILAYSAANERSCEGARGVSEPPE